MLRPETVFKGARSGHRLGHGGSCRRGPADRAPFGPAFQDQTVAPGRLDETSYSGIPASQRA